MTPTLRTGDSIIMAGVDPAQIAPGDLAVYAGGARLYAHRFVRWLPEGARARLMEFAGDAKTEPDPPVPAAALLGRIIAVERAVRPERGWSRALGAVIGTAQRRAGSAMRLLRLRLHPLTRL